VPFIGATSASGLGRAVAALERFRATAVERFRAAAFLGAMRRFAGRAGFLAREREDDFAMKCSPVESDAAR
jgi:hypothetical protein